MLIFIGQFLLIFCAACLADVCWTKYMLEVGKKNAIFAATWSALIVAVGGFTVISYTINHWFILASLIGSWVGTYITIGREKKVDQE